MGTERSRISTAERVFDRVPVLEPLARVFDLVPVPALLALEFVPVQVRELGLRRARLVELELPLGLRVEREPLGLAVAEQVHDPGVERALGQPVVVVAAIVWVAINRRWAAGAGRSAVAVQISLAPVAAEAVPAWAAVDSAVAEEVVVVVAAADVAVAVADAGDEQFSNGIKTYEIENKHHEAIKNFFARLCDHYARCGGVFIAGRTGKNQAECDGRFSVQTKTIQHPERGDR
jgi:hypothetical protein